MPPVRAVKGKGQPVAHKRETLTSVSKSEAKYALTKSFTNNFTWKIDGLSYSSTHKQQFKVENDMEL